MEHVRRPSISAVGQSVKTAAFAAAVVLAAEAESGAGISARIKWIGHSARLQPHLPTGSKPSLFGRAAQLLAGAGLVIERRSSFVISATPTGMGQNRAVWPRNSSNTG
jgi:hypothetical protein